MSRNMQKNYTTTSKFSLPPSLLIHASLSGQTRASDRLIHTVWLFHKTTAIVILLIFMSWWPPYDHFALVLKSLSFFYYYWHIVIGHRTHDVKHGTTNSIFNLKVGSVDFEKRLIFEINPPLSSLLRLQNSHSNPNYPAPRRSRTLARPLLTGEASALTITLNTAFSSGCQRAVVYLTIWPLLHTQCKSECLFITADTQ